MMSRKFQLPVVILSIGGLSAACSQTRRAPIGPDIQAASAERAAPVTDATPSEPQRMSAPSEQPALAAEPVASASATGTEPAHFFTNKRIVMVHQPEGLATDESTRVAVYYTSDNGATWKRAGTFDTDQPYFPLETDDDGDYGVRFVAAEIPGEDAPAAPARVYHVDTGLPDVEIEIDPEKPWYDIGDDIRIAWAARDPHLEPYPVRLGMLMDFSAASRDLIELQRDLADEGSIEYRISTETAGHEIVFRAEALDRAGNLGLAYSRALEVKARDAEGLAQLPARHHDDTIAATRKTTDRPAGDRPLPAQMTRLEPIRRESATASRATPPKEKTRVKVVTIRGPDANTDNTDTAASRHDAMTAVSTRGQPPASIAARSAPIAAMQSPTLPATDGTASKQAPSPVTAAEATLARNDAGDNDEFAQMLDCDEQEKFDATVSPQPPEDDIKPAVAMSAPPANDKPAAASSMTVEKAWAPLKRAIERISAMTEAATKNQGMATASRSTKEPAPAATPVTVATKPAPAKRTERLRPAAAPIPPMAVSTGSRAMDLTRGSALVVPMPGTVASPGATADATVHPWRILGRQPTAGTVGHNSTWSLPEQKAAVRTAAVEPPTKTPVFAGVASEDETPSKGME